LAATTFGDSEVPKANASARLDGALDGERLTQLDATFTAREACTVALEASCGAPITTTVWQR
jgi:hypothetical protein